MLLEELLRATESPLSTIYTSLKCLKLVTTANDEYTVIYHTGNLLASMVAISYAQTPPTAEIGPIVVTQYSKEKMISILTESHACIYNRVKQVTVMQYFFSKPDSEGPWIA